MVLKLASRSLTVTVRTARALREGGWAGRTVTGKLRLASFNTITRSRTLPDPTDLTRTIYETACALYEGSGLDGAARLRLIGVRMTGLTTASDATTQLALDDKPTGWREAERAMDRITQRFGAGAVRPAVLVDGERDQGHRDQGHEPGHRPSGYRESSPDSG